MRTNYTANQPYYKRRYDPTAGCPMSQLAVADSRDQLGRVTQNVFPDLRSFLARLGYEHNRGMMT